MKQYILPCDYKPEEYKPLVLSESFEALIKEHRSNKVCFILDVLNNRCSLPFLPKPKYISKRAGRELPINYLTARKDGTLSYLPKGKEHKVNDSGEWSRENRVNSKPAKAVRKLIEPLVRSRYITDSDLESFSNLFKAHCKSRELEFSLTDTPSEIYDHDNIASEGTLKESCMNGDGEYMDMYDCNKNVSMVYAEKDGELVGRALLWDEVHCRLGKIKVMDRIYYAHDWMVESFKTWAHDNGYAYQLSQSSGYNGIILPDGTEFCDTLTVYVDTDHEHYPYLDTFQYGEDGSLNTCSGQYEYTETDGCRSGDRRCPMTGYLLDDYNGVYITRGMYQDEYVYEDEAICVNDDWYTTSDEGKNIHYVDGEWYEDEDLVTCAYTGDYIHIDNSVVIDVGTYEGDCVHVDEAQCIDEGEHAGEWVIADEYDQYNNVGTETETI